MHWGARTLKVWAGEKKRHKWVFFSLRRKMITYGDGDSAFVYGGFDLLSVLQYTIWLAGVGALNVYLHVSDLLILGALAVLPLVLFSWSLWRSMRRY